MPQMPRVRLRLPFTQFQLVNQFLSLVQAHSFRIVILQGLLLPELFRLELLCFFSGPEELADGDSGAGLLGFCMELSSAFARSSASFSSNFFFNTLSFSPYYMLVKSNSHIACLEGPLTRSALRILVAASVLMVKVR